MNILFLSHIYPEKNNFRGAFIQEQAKALNKTHNVIVVVFSVNYSAFSPFSNYSVTKTTEDNLTIYNLIIAKSFPVYNQLNYLNTAKKFILNKIISQHKIDIIHCHFSYPTGYLGYLLNKKTNIPFVITEHSRFNAYFKTFIHKKLSILAIQNANAVIAVSEFLKNQITPFTKKPINSIHNIVDTNKFSINTTNDSTINIGFLGNFINNNKGLDILLLALTKIKNKNIYLHIGGSGHLLQSYQKMAEQLELTDKCKFYGEIFIDKIPHFFSKLNLFISASRFETFGIVLIEAMACGIPVITTKSGGPQQFITNETGILVEPEDAEGLANAIDLIISRLHQYDHEYIRKYAIDNFGVDAFVSQINTVYKNVLK